MDAGWSIFWLIINAIVGAMIGQRNNDVAGSIIISILLGPIGWLIALLSKGKLRKCPFCAESIKPEAKVCRHCGRELPAQAQEAIYPKAKIKPVQSDLKPAEPFPLSAVIILISLVLLSGAMAIYGKYHQKNAEPPRGDTAIHEHVIHDAWPTRSPTVSPAVTPQQISYPTLTLVKPVELKDSVGRVKARLQPGESLQCTYRDDYLALVRYQGRDYEILTHLRISNEARETDQSRRFF
jgi:hypothetical protein